MPAKWIEPLPEGMPGTPVCQAALAKSVLAPPPPEQMGSPPWLAKEAQALSSFQACSGTGFNREVMVSAVLLAVAQ